MPSLEDLGEPLGTPAGWATVTVRTAPDFHIPLAWDFRHAQWQFSGQHSLSSDSSSGDTDDSEQSFDEERHSRLCRNRANTRRAAREVCRTVYAGAYHICSFKTKRLPRRLVNIPLSEEMRETYFRAVVSQYCDMLYRAARPKVEFKEIRSNEVAEFASFAKELDGHVISAIERDSHPDTK